MKRISIIVICSVIAVTALICTITHFKSGQEVFIKNQNDTSQTDSTACSNIETTIDKTDWKLILVNADNKLPNEYSISMATLENGLLADSRCYPDLQKMLDDCRSEGLNPIVCSAYRSQEKQEILFKNQIEKQKSTGLSDQEAETEAKKLVAVPGTSEHQTGLAFDIIDADYQLLDEEQEKTKVQQWLLKNSWKYGFILRYPPDKSDITKISYEPWHYRYVGKENAKIIYDKALCLEEYLYLH